MISNDWKKRRRQFPTVGNLSRSIVLLSLMFITSCSTHVGSYSTIALDGDWRLLQVRQNEGVRLEEYSTDMSKSNIWLILHNGYMTYVRDGRVVQSSPIRIERIIGNYTIFQPLEKEDSSPIYGHSRDWMMIETNRLLVAWAGWDADSQLFCQNPRINIFERGKIFEEEIQQK